MIALMGAAAHPAQSVFVGGVPLAAMRAKPVGAAAVSAAAVADPTPTVYLDLALRVRSVNRVFEERFNLSHGILEGRNFLMSDGARWNHPELHALLVRLAAASGTTAYTDSCTIPMQEEGTDLHISARRVFDGGGRAPGHGLICLTLEETPSTEQTASPLPVHAPSEEFIASLSLEMQQALQSLSGALALLSRTGDPQVKGDLCMLNAQMPRLHRICADLNRYATCRYDGTVTDPGEPSEA